MDLDLPARSGDVPSLARLSAPRFWIMDLVYEPTRCGHKPVMGGVHGGKSQ